jgi:hypothetical protein
MITTLETVLIFYKQPLLIIFLLFSPDDLNVFSIISALSVALLRQIARYLLHQSDESDPKYISSHEAKKSKQFFSFVPSKQEVNPYCFGF